MTSGKAKFKYLQALIHKKSVSIGLKVLAIPNIKRYQQVSLLSILTSILRDRHIVSDGFVLSNYGIWLKENSKDRTYRLGLLGYRNQLEKFLREVSQETIFVDVGANQGVFTLIASRNLNFVSIHAFEPNPIVYEILKENVYRCNSKMIHLHNKAISKKEGLVGFEFKEDHSGGGKLTENKDFLVQAVDHNYLDEILENATQPLFFKIDVEGAESEVLNQISLMKKFLQVKFVFIELNDSLNDLSLLRSFLAKNGFIQIWASKNGKNPDGFFVRE